MTNDNPLKIGSVSYLNAKPLIHNLENDPDVDLHLAVPAQLLEGMRSRRYDIALLPVIDYQRLPEARVVPSGGIGCDGPTLTVRYLQPGPNQKKSPRSPATLESHTSVALAQIILAEQYGIIPQLIDLPGNANDAQAMLLIGDKVVTHQPPATPHQLDLGAAWKDLTHMPFVFAVWITHAGTALIYGNLPKRLEQARIQGLSDLPNIIARHAITLGWPEDLATQYLSTYLKFEIAQPQLTAIRHFHELAAKHKIIPAPRPLKLYSTIHPKEF